jgi:hypothetical protein
MDQSVEPKFSFKGMSFIDHFIPVKLAGLGPRTVGICAINPIISLRKNQLTNRLGGGFSSRIFHKLKKCKLALFSSPFFWAHFQIMKPSL